MNALTRWLEPLTLSPISALSLVLLIIMAALLWRALPPMDTRPARSIQAKFGAETWPPPLFWAVSALWLLFALFVLIGIFHAISEFLGLAPPAKNDAVAMGDLRFLLTRMAALIAVLSAVIALPFTVIRLRLASEQNSREERAHYNDKINAALDDLHAMRQRSVDDKPEKTIWEADVTRRNGAIDRLEALAHENPDEAPRIARTLCTYVKELSREFPAKPEPEDTAPDELEYWALFLTPARSDMENAAQTLGRLIDVDGMTAEALKIDLRGANLQGFDLRDLNFEKANLSRAEMQGAIFIGAKLQRTRLIRAEMQGANCQFADFTGAVFSGANLSSVIFDEATLNKCLFRGATLDHTDFSGASVTKSDFAHARIKNCKCYGEADFTGSRFTGADWSQCIGIDEGPPNVIWQNGEVFVAGQES